MRCFNPASVIKVATSFAALSKFGPDYHFQTGFLSDGVINKKTRTLNGNLVLQSTALGLVVHQMAGFDVEKARADCLIPPRFDPVAMIAVGYPGDPAVLPDYLREREVKPRGRQPADDFVFSGQWGRRSPLIG